MMVVAATSLGHPLDSSGIAFYSTLAVVNTFIIGGVIFNFRAENNLRRGNKRDRHAFTYPIMLLVASETFALAVLYYGRDNGQVRFWTAFLAMLGAGSFFSFLTARIIDPEGNAFAKASKKEARAIGVYTSLFALSILIPIFLMLGLK
jgi:hypothetical protein